LQLHGSKQQVSGSLHLRVTQPPGTHSVTVFHSPQQTVICLVSITGLQTVRQCCTILVS